MVQDRISPPDPPQTARQKALNPLPDGKDISSELYRLYTFPGGQTVRVEAPATLYVTHHGESGDSHRIVRENGNGVYVRRGWLSIEWQPRTGSPTLVA